MGWTDSHLHSFEVGADSYGTPDPDWGSDLQDERRVRLCQLGLSAGSRLRYTYDFGDDWQHDVLVEQIVAPEPGVAYPRCLGGRRACPPGDRGVTPSCSRYWQIPITKTTRSGWEWMGGDVDPADFDREEVDLLLRSLTY